jgi:glycosyltransferase involved in cell wall biosynthesis
MQPLISVCIPTYNRAKLLPELLESILSQDFEDFEVVICENDSPEREKIRAIVDDYKKRTPRMIRYFENENNIGYDANIRKLVNCATGEYLFFTGNDDLLAPGALAAVASAVKRYKNVGVVLRTYATFDETPDKVDQVFRYFSGERFFPAGPSTIVTFFKRCVVLPGVTIHRESALKVNQTDIFDGRTLYQIYLVANILVDMNGIFLPRVIAYYRKGGVPDFGNTEVEKAGNYVPGQQTPESSLFMMQGFLDIARYVEETRNVKIHDSIERDLANYSFGFIGVQKSKPLSVFLKYVVQLGRIGYGRHIMYWAYVASLLFLGEKQSWKLMAFIKRKLGRTPNIGNVYSGVDKQNVSHFIN